MITMKIQGLKEIQQALRELLPERSAKAVMSRVLMKYARPMAQEAAAAAPVRSGRLRVSVKAGIKLSRRQRAMHRKVDPNDVEVFVGAGPLPQAHMSEYGTSREQARPFLRPVWDRHKGTILERVGRDMWTEIAASVTRRAKRLAGGGS